MDVVLGRKTFKFYDSSLSSRSWEIMVCTQFGVLKDKVMRLRFNFMTEYHQTLASQLGNVEGV